MSSHLNFPDFPNFLLFSQYQKYLQQHKNHITSIKMANNSLSMNVFIEQFASETRFIDEEVFF